MSCSQNMIFTEHTDWHGGLRWGVVWCTAYMGCRFMYGIYYLMFHVRHILVNVSCMAHVTWYEWYLNKCMHLLCINDTSTSTYDVYHLHQTIRDVYDLHQTIRPSHIRMAIHLELPVCSAFSLSAAPFHTHVFAYECMYIHNHISMCICMYVYIAGGQGGEADDTLADDEYRDEET